MKNNRKKRDLLESKAKSELLKTQQIAQSDMVKEHLLTIKNSKLRKDINIRDLLEKKLKSAQPKLLERIEEQQSLLDDLVMDIESTNTELHGANDKARIAIAKLRKIDPKRANELENSLSLKDRTRKSRIITKKRL
ncbi:hypothetical protein [Vibrio rotiferianus]|uniref:hypothetical protein n=2 Tax=Vibrio rotiferianus TaxID=190895 RepID=UPI000C3B3BDB|nr:hypothetical protein [Vibrio rotiferianus]PIB15521.1 hypothetical protein B853_15009 [Vibrio rotiferianus CAIM 577 = LMG 21460]